MKRRQPIDVDDTRRSLTPAQRAELVARIEAVPLDSTSPNMTTTTSTAYSEAIMALLGYVRALRVPWWVDEGFFDHRLRLGDRSGLETLRRLAVVTDWGERPKGVESPGERALREQWERITTKEERDQVYIDHLERQKRQGRLT